MKTTDPYIEKFPMEFYADPRTAFIKPVDTRTPYEQYESGKKWIYVDLSDIFPDEKPYWITREGYYNKFIHPRSPADRYWVSKYNMQIKLLGPKNNTE